MDRLNGLRVIDGFVRTDQGAGANGHVPVLCVVLRSRSVCWGRKPAPVPGGRKLLSRRPQPSRPVRLRLARRPEKVKMKSLRWLVIAALALAPTTAAVSAGGSSAACCGQFQNAGPWGGRSQFSLCIAVAGCGTGNHTSPSRTRATRAHSPALRAITSAWSRRQILAVGTPARAIRIATGISRRRRAAMVSKGERAPNLSSSDAAARPR